MIVKRIVYLRLKFIKIGCENLKKYHVNIMEEIANNRLVINSFKISTKKYEY